MDNITTTRMAPPSPVELILKGNYGELLQWAGISHLQFSVMVIVIFLIMSFVYLLVKLGLTQGIKFKN